MPVFVFAVHYLWLAMYLQCLCVACLPYLWLACHVFAMHYLWLACLAVCLAAWHPMYTYIYIYIFMYIYIYIHVWVYITHTYIRVHIHIVVHYKHVALAKKTSVPREAMLLVVELRRVGKHNSTILSRRVRRHCRGRVKLTTVVLFRPYIRNSLHPISAIVGKINRSEDRLYTPPPPPRGGGV